MNQQLKTYARQARRDFIAAVTDRASFYGLTPDVIEPVIEQGDTVLIGDRPYPRDVAAKRTLLVEKRFTRDDDFDQTIEAMAFTWFNRFVAIRYMELHGYLDHGYRVLSHPEGDEQPEILVHAADIDLPGLDRDKAVDLKLDGAKDEELYRLLLQAQCNALHRAMPFLFDPVGDETELLLPANLLHTDSLIRQLVNCTDESDWDKIEIVGWLYQFYISEKKDEVIGKVVQPKDIPAATQLFTPNWIVKYMVQNSLGAQWLATYPNSSLKGKMEYFIEPAEQTEEVDAELKAITPDSLNPEKLTLIDPACGSGHILVEAYGLFKAIYLERGYRQTDVPKLILEKNLFGLDIDERAAQLTGFALMMKGREDDRRLFDRKVKLNVMTLVNSAGFDVEELAERVNLDDYGLRVGDLIELKRLFEHATTFGALIQIPDDQARQLPSLKQLSEATSRNIFVSNALTRLGTLVKNATLLSAQYDTVATNPPYMGSGATHAIVKGFIKRLYPEAKRDLFACFIVRGCMFANRGGYNAMVTMQSWMFLSSYKDMREQLLRRKTIMTMAHLGARAFGSISGEVVQTVAFVIANHSPQKFIPVFLRLVDGGEDKKRSDLSKGRNRYDSTSQSEFSMIPGSPLAYWVSSRFRANFEKFASLGDLADVKKGMITSDNNRFLRRWHEVSFAKCRFHVASKKEASQSGGKWFPYNKGGGWRKWFGNNFYVVNWEDDGREVIALNAKLYGSASRQIQNVNYYFKPSLTWSGLSSSGFSVRRCPAGFIFDSNGPSIFAGKVSLDVLHNFCASSVADYYLSAINSTMSYLTANVAALPVAQERKGMESSTDNSAIASEMAKVDWDAYERSWDFQSFPIADCSDGGLTLEVCYVAWIAQIRDTVAAMKHLEEENNRVFIDAYGVQGELSPDVPIDQITLTVNSAYRYGGKLTEEEQQTRFRKDTMQELVSYAIGCMMGRYSLDEPGLIYAHSGNEDFDSSLYTTFPADQDGIIPITDDQCFDDDVAHRLIEFISVAWDADRLEDNLSFLADNLSPRKNDTSRDTIRRYLRDSFFKDHLQTYKNRPIYWLFSSGKAKAFQCLVYLHRYNEGTLARMRTEYVVPLQGMMESRVRRLDDDIAAAASTAHRRRLEKERSTLLKQQAELQAFDEKLRHSADQRINLDLDDGVKVNYGKFGDLLAEVKKVTGRKAD